jgi:hypothetical protein
MTPRGYDASDKSAPIVWSRMLAIESTPKLHVALSN